MRYGRLYLIVMTLAVLVLLTSLLVFIPTLELGDRVAYSIALLGIAGTLGLPGAIGWYERRERLRHDAASDAKAKALQDDVERLTKQGDTLRDELRRPNEADPFALGTLTMLKCLAETLHGERDKWVRARATAAAGRMGVGKEIIDDYWLDLSDRRGRTPAELYRAFVDDVEGPVVDRFSLQLFHLGRRLANLSVSYGMLANRIEFLGDKAKAAPDVLETIEKSPKLLAETMTAFKEVKEQISDRLRSAVEEVLRQFEAAQSAIDTGPLGSSVVAILMRVSEATSEVLTTFT